MQVSHRIFAIRTKVLLSTRTCVSAELWKCRSRKFVDYAFLFGYFYQVGGVLTCSPSISYKWAISFYKISFLSCQRGSLTCPVKSPFFFGNWRGSGLRLYWCNFCVMICDVKNHFIISSPCDNTSISSFICVTTITQDLGLSSIISNFISDVG